MDPPTRPPCRAGCFGLGRRGAVASAASEPEQTDWRQENPPPRPATIPRSAFAGFPSPPEVIVLAVRWSLRFGLSYRDVEELLAERGIDVDHVTVYRWVQRFTPLLAEAGRPCRHRIGDRWQVDETYVRVAGRWRYVYRAIDQFGQVIDMLVCPRRDAAAARRFLDGPLVRRRDAYQVVTTGQRPTRSWCRSWRRVHRRLVGGDLDGRDLGRAQGEGGEFSC